MIAFRDDQGSVRLVLVDKVLGESGVWEVVGPNGKKFQCFDLIDGTEAYSQLLLVRPALHGFRNEEDALLALRGPGRQGLFSQKAHEVKSTWYVTGLCRVLWPEGRDEVVRAQTHVATPPPGLLTARKESPSETGSERLEELYQRWEKGIESQLAEGKSWVRGDDDAVQALAGLVPDNLDYFRAKLAANMFVVGILEASPLHAQYQKRFGERAGLQAQQETWLGILEERGAQ